MRRPVLALTLAVMALAGCGGDDDGGDPATTSAESTPAPSGDGGRAGRPLRNEGSSPRLETVATGLDIPWEIAFLPDGSALVTERAGHVRVLSAGGRLEPGRVADVEVAAVGEGGLLGLAVDPRFRSNRFVYLYRTTESGNEVLRYRYEGGELTEDGLVLDGIQAGAIHDGGRIHFGPDGALYVSTGETGDPDLAQDPDSLNGKILRIADPRPGGSEPEVVSLGHRNVQGFDWDSEGRLFATEFGPDSDDEVNLIREGENYGWPDAQGKESEDGSEPALVNYEEVIAPSGATFVSLPSSAWSGDFLFANLVGEQVRRLDLDGAEVTGDHALFEGDLGRVRTVVEGPDGAIYALTNNTDGRGSPREGDDRIIRIVPPAA